MGETHPDTIAALRRVGFALTALDRGSEASAVARKIRKLETRAQSSSADGAAVDKRAAGAEADAAPVEPLSMSLVQQGTSTLKGAQLEGRPEAVASGRSHAGGSLLALAAATEAARQRDEEESSGNGGFGSGSIGFSFGLFGSGGSGDAASRTSRSFDAMFPWQRSIGASSSTGLHSAQAPDSGQLALDAKAAWVPASAATQRALALPRHASLDRLPLAGAELEAEWPTSRQGAGWASVSPAEGNVGGSVRRKSQEL